MSAKRRVQDTPSSLNVASPEKLPVTEPNIKYKLSQRLANVMSKKRQDKLVINPDNEFVDLSSVNIISQLHPQRSKNVQVIRQFDPNYKKEIGKLAPLVNDSVRQVNLEAMHE